MSSSENTPEAGGPAPGEPVHEPSVHTGMEDSKGRRINPWAWIPTVYLAQGLQYAVVIQLFGIVFFTMGVPIGTALFWAAILNLPWVLKPLWGPLVDRYWTKRSWTFWMQILVGLSFAATGFVLQTPLFFGLSIAILLVMAFAAATHDIACDGYYMLGLREKQQAFFVGIRSTFFRFGMIIAGGALPWVAFAVITATSLDPVEFRAYSIIEEVAEEVNAETHANDLQEVASRAAAASEGQAIIITPTEIGVKPGESSEFHVRLAEDPGPDSTVRVIIRFVSGDQSLSIPQEQQRFEFDTLTWEIGFTGEVRAHEHVTEEVEAFYEATAGNVPLGWAVAMAVCAIYFLFVGVYHRFILPYPAQDAPETVDRPPFIVPLLALGATVGLPLLIGYGAFVGLGKSNDFFMERTVGIPAERTLRANLEEQNFADQALELRVSGILELAGQVRDDEISTEQAIAEIEVPRELLLLAVETDEADRVRNMLLEMDYPETAMNEEIDRLREAGRDALEEDADLEEIAQEADISVAELQNIAELVEQEPTALEVRGYDFFFAMSRLILIVLIGVAILSLGALRAPVSSAFHYMSDVSRIGFADVFVSFFTKANMGIVVAFLLTFRLGEAQLIHIRNIFLLDDRGNDGMAISLGQLAFTNGVVYTGALLVGGVLGGIILARFGLKAVIWYMVAAMHLPNLLYAWLAYAQPESFFWINAVVGIESFGFGFGFTAYLLIMILAAQGPYKTAHYALCTGFMAMGIMIPGMWTGFLAELTGYFTFFILVMIFTLPGVILIPFLKIDPNFGMRGR